MPITIENTTPWNTDDLTKFLTPLCERTGTVTCEVVILPAMPGRKRSEQSLFDVHYPHPYRVRALPHIKVSLLSPKRAAVRTELIDRMAQATDLVMHESALPSKIAQGVVHAFDKAAEWLNGGTFEWSHVDGSCKCDVSALPTALIRGNTKVKTAPPISIESMKSKLRSTKNAIHTHTRRRNRHARDMKKNQDLLDRAEARRAKLEERIAKEEEAKRK